LFRRKLVAEVFNTARSRSGDYYGAFVNDGTRFIRARRFVERGLKKSNPKITKILEKETDKALKKIFK
jgi:hypothetical protein